MRGRAVLLVVAFTLLLAAVRWLFPGLPATYTGPLAILEPALALGILALILLLAGSLGGQILRRLKLEGLSHLEQVVIALPLGLGILAYGVLALGLVGWLRPGAILVWLGAAGVWTWREWSSLVSHLPRWLACRFAAFRELGRGEKALAGVGGLILLASLLHALTPPWDYDGLMYHLDGQRRFLQAGRILLLPDIWQANGPSTAEMLFTVGLAWGTDVLAKLIHLAYAVCFILASFAFGRRYLGRAEGWIAIVLLLGIPIFPIWSDTAYTDIAWALYEFLALYALVLWRESRGRRWLVMGGVMIGLALGSKYLALGGLGVLGLWVLWQERRAGWKGMLIAGVLLALPAALVAFPWYAKNWFLSGNPLYPFVFGGPGWGPDRLEHLMEYLGSFGVGHSFLDYLLLPWNLYAQNIKFGTIGAALDIPGLLFPLALLYPLRPRNRILDAIACVSAMRFVVWAMGSQQTRFLLPIFPPLALLGAGVLVWVVHHLKTRWKASPPLVLFLISAPVLVTLFVQVVLFYVLPPTSVLLGLESRDAFLQHRVVNYSALQFVQDNLSEDDRVLMMWDGRGYYCDARCLPDADQSNWTRVVDGATDPARVAARLNADGVTHLLLNHQDAEFFLNHDPSGRHRQAFEFFLQSFLSACTEEVYRDQEMMLISLTCRP